MSSKFLYIGKASHFYPGLKEEEKRLANPFYIHDTHPTIPEWVDNLFPNLDAVAKVCISRMKESPGYGILFDLSDIKNRRLVGYYLPQSGQVKFLEVKNLSPNEAGSLLGKIVNLGIITSKVS